jgi:hypothetical protein
LALLNGCEQIFFVFDGAIKPLENGIVCFSLLADVFILLFGVKSCKELLFCIIIHHISEFFFICFIIIIFRAVLDINFIKFVILIMFYLWLLRAMMHLDIFIYAYNFLHILIMYGVLSF